MVKASLTLSTKALGMRVVSHARILGIDTYGAGAARQRRTQCGRLTKIKKRMPKVQFYKKYGAVTSKIAKAVLMPSGLHGVRCMGMPPTRLKAFRTTVGRCLPGKHAGRSLTWRLAMHQCDPTHPCRVEPIVAWTEAVWNRAAGRRRSNTRHGGVRLKPSWGKVSGPTGAIIMCLRQLGWTWSAPGTPKCRRQWTANWRCGESGRTTTNGRSCSRALCWNQWYWQTNEFTVDRKRHQRSRRFLV